MSRPAILVTGMPACGKSTVFEELRRRGLPCLDIDAGYAYWADRATGKPATYKPADLTWLLAHEWKLDVPKLATAIAAAKAPLYVCGVVNDVTQYFELFETVFLLAYPSTSTLAERLLQRPDVGNPYGKTPEEAADSVRTCDYFQTSALQHGARAIDCTLPTPIIVDTIVEAPY